MIKFQFHKVQLIQQGKLYDVQVLGFQFHKVQLIPDEAIKKINVMIKFQFHKVQLILSYPDGQSFRHFHFNSIRYN